MISKSKSKKEAGFIALITAIALTLILLVVTVTLNQSGFFTRSTLLESEYKERSSALAEACVDTALLKLANNPNYIGPDTIAVGGDSCSILSVSLPSGGHQTIRTRAVFREAATNLEVAINTSDLSVVSWNELPHF